ncbi:MAG: hypothetical protein EOP86_23195 [Verrucomicrobiaceae bacterium]|nr:MAG: hypothetical protein EOP86_23195 [Verrucomicrobiaceae bacterium]
MTPAPRFPILRSRGFWLALWIGWFLTLFVLSSMRHPGPEIHVRHIDKVEHAVFFALGGAVLALWRLFPRNPLSGEVGAVISHPAPEPVPLASVGGTALLVVLTGAAVGWFDEWHQSFTPGRSGLDVYDWMADITGSLLAVPLALGILRFLKRRQRANRD